MYGDMVGDFNSQKAFISKYKESRNWSSFLDKYKDTFKDYDGYLRIKRDLFGKIEGLMLAICTISLEKKVSKKHTAFIFSLFLILSQMRKSGVPLSIQQLKELLGYNRGTDSIDYLTKADGDLDSFGMTLTKTIGIKQGVRTDIGKTKSIKIKGLTKQYKYSTKDFNEGSFVTLQTEVLMYMLFHINEIEVQGIFLYCYLLTKCINNGEGYYTVLTKLSMDKIVKETGISRNTAEKYLSVLEKYGLLEIKRGAIIHDDWEDFDRKEVNEYRIEVRLNEKCKLS